VDPSIHNRIKDILPPGGLLTDPNELQRYRRDGSAKNPLPLAVLLPKTTAQIQEIVRLAYEERLPLTLRGGGTGQQGGAAPPEGSLLVSLSRMDRILEVSPENSMGVVQPGVNASRLEKHLETFGLSYPVDPASWRSSTIGGDVATRAHGLRGARYGPIGGYLLGLEVVISPGEIIRCGARTLKCATGYHLVDLFAGSRGQLGIITQIIVKLIPRLPVRRTFLADLRDLEAAAHIPGLLNEAGLQPVRLELIGPQAARLGFVKLLEEDRQDRCLLLMELEADEPEHLEEQIERARICFHDPAISPALANIRPEEAGDWWRRREELLRRLTADGRPSLLVTARIPPSRLPSFRKKAAAILRESSCEGLLYGHLAEGRWHLLIRRTDEQPVPNGPLPGISRALEEITVACGGLYLPPSPFGWTPQETLVSLDCPSDRVLSRPAAAFIERRFVRQLLIFLLLGIFRGIISTFRCLD
jgi:glycolate oxidase